LEYIERFYKEGGLTVVAERKFERSNRVNHLASLLAKVISQQQAYVEEDGVAIL